MAHLSNIEGLEMEGKLPEVRLATTPFRVVAPYEPSGDQPQAIDKLATWRGRGPALPDASGRDRIRQDVHHGEDHRGRAEAHAGHGAEQDARGAAGKRAQGVLSGQRRGVLRLATTTTTSPRPTSRRRTRSSRRTPPSTRRWRSCAMRPPRRCCRGATASWWRRCRCIYGIGSPDGLRRHGRVRGQAEASMDRDDVIHELHRHPVRPQRLRAASAARSACAATRSTCSRPTRTTRSASSSGATRLSPSPRSTHVTGEVMNEFEALPIWPGVALRGHAPEDGPRACHHPRRAARAPAAVQGGGQAAGGAAPGDAHELRPGDAGDDGLLLGHRELLAPHRRTRARRAALHAASTTFPRTSSASSTRATSPCRRSAACTKATVRARSRLPSTASACPAAWTTARCASTSSRSASRSSCTCRPRQATTSRSVSQQQVEQIIRPTGLLDPRDHRAQPSVADRRSSSTRRRIAPHATSGCSSPRSRRRWPRI